MWTLRRASIHLKNRGICSGTALLNNRKSEIARCYLDNFNMGLFELDEKLSDGLQSSKFYHSFSSFPKTCCEARSFSSQADDTCNVKEDTDLEDGFSELETTNDAIKKSDSDDESDDGLISESELSEQEEDPIDAELKEKKTFKTRTLNAITKSIMACPPPSVSKVLDKLLEEGNEVTEADVTSTLVSLRKRKMYLKALLVIALTPINLIFSL